MGSHTAGLPGAIKPGKYSSQTHSTLHRSQGEFFCSSKKGSTSWSQITNFLLHAPIDIFYLYAIKLTWSLSFLEGYQALPQNANRNTTFPDMKWMWVSCLWSSCGVSKSRHVGWARRRLWRCTSTRALIRLFSHNNPFYEKMLKFASHVIILRNIFFWLLEYLNTDWSQSKGFSFVLSWSSWWRVKYCCLTAV